MEFPVRTLKHWLGVVVVLIAVFLFANLALAADVVGEALVESAVRAPNEPWEEAAERNFERNASISAHLAAPLATPEQWAVPMEQVSSQLANLPEWRGPISGIARAFEIARDERHYSDGKHDFLRRSSWMYPDDGCFVRASHVAASLERAGLVRPGRVFAFGNLKMKTEFNSRGAVYWWYHVAAAYRSGNHIVVIDPAAHYDRPLLLEEWVGRINSKPGATKVALCDTHAYMAAQTCMGGGPEQERGQPSHQKSYLGSEWNRLSRLGKNPDVTLRQNTGWGVRDSFDYGFALAR